jgi:hypothetical protein
MTMTRTRPLLSLLAGRKSLVPFNARVLPQTEHLNRSCSHSRAVDYQQPQDIIDFTKAATKPRSSSGKMLQ